jgi:peptidoglycan/LPS O-acetylase OafA/YrhL
MRPSSHPIPSLDGIRAMSFMIVFGSHAFGGTRVPGDLGVTIFFFLSGYLITTLLRMEIERTGSIHLAHFWQRRALRIIPPLLVVVLTTTLLAHIFYPPGAVSGANLAANLLFYDNYWQLFGDGRPDIPGLGVVWSLAVEEHFYLLFPLLYLAMQKMRLSRRGQAMLLWGLCAAVLVWRCILVIATHASSARVFFGTDTRIDAILFGCALAVWRNPALDGAYPAPNLLRYILLPASLIVVIACAYSRGTVFTDTGCFSLEGIGLTFLFIGAMELHRAPLFRVLNFRPVMILGVLSYSLYLVHEVVLRAIRTQWTSIAGSAVAALFLSVLAAAVLYLAIERPCARLRRALVD